MHMSHNYRKIFHNYGKALPIVMAYMVKVTPVFVCQCK